MKFRIPPGFIVIGLVGIGVVGFMNRDRLPFIGGNHVNNRQQAVEVQKGLEDLQTVVPFTGNATYGGSTTFAGFRIPMDAYMRSQGLLVSYVQPSNNKPSSSEGIQQLLSGDVLFAQSSRALTENEKGKGLEEIPVASSAIAIVVNRNASIDNISTEDLRAIFSGRNRQFTAISRSTASGTVEEFINKMLGSNQIWADKEVTTLTQSLQAVVQNPNGITFASYPEVMNQRSIKVIRLDGKLPTSDEYPLTTQLYVVYKKGNQRSEQAAKTYAKYMGTNQAKAILADKGYL